MRALRFRLDRPLAEYVFSFAAGCGVMEGGGLDGARIAFPATPPCVMAADAVGTGASIRRT